MKKTHASEKKRTEEQDSRVSSAPVDASSDQQNIASAFKEMREALDAPAVSKDQLYVWFKEEIDRKDKLIAELKKENALLFRTAMRANERVQKEEKHVSRTG